MINFGLAPYFQEFIQLILTDASFYVPCFDEGHNSTLKKGQMDLHVRFWDNSSNIVQTRYLISCLMGKATAQDVYDNFKECFTSVDDKKIIQVSSDGPNVNHKFLNLMRENRKENSLPELLEIGICGLHIVHGSFKYGLNATKWDLDKILSAMWKIFDQSPSRRADFESQTSGNYPLQFCSYRCDENERVAQRALVVWLDIVKVFKFWMSLLK